MKEIGIATRLSNNSKKNKPQVQSKIQTIKIDYEATLTPRPLWKIITHRIGLILVVAVGVTAGVSVWTYQQTPRYLGKFQLLVEPGQNDSQLNQLPPENQSQQPIPNPSESAVEYDTQVEILRSPKILNPILDKISPQYGHLDYKSLAKQQKTKEDPLKITRLPKTQILEVSYEDENPQKILSILNTLADAYVRYGKELRESELKQGIEFVNAQLPKLQQRVSQSEEKLQKLRQRYNIIDPQQQANQLSKFLVDLETQLYNTQVQLKETTSLYQKLQKEIGLNTQEALTASYLSESPRYQYLLNQLQQVELEIAKESTIFVEDSPIIQTLREKQANIKSLIQQESAKVLGNNSSESIKINQPTPKGDSPSSVRLALNQQLVQSANQIEVLEARRSVLEKQIQNLKTQIQQIPQIARQYTDIQRQITIASESVSRFLDAQEKIQIEASQKLSPWELLSSPELLEEPIYPIPSKNLSLGMLAGIVLGIVAAVVAEKLDTKFHSPEEIKEITRLPILGYIPIQKNLHNLKPSQELNLLSSHLNSAQSSTEFSNIPKKPYQSFDHFSAFLEACMSLYANISLLESPSTQPLKSIVISSATAAEGKSTIALYLAQVAAVMGQRVLLVETNLRDPQYYQWIDVSAQQGLTEILTLDLDVTTAIQKVPQWENLSILMPGNLPANPAQLLASEKMQHLIEQLHQDNHYDLVIYDTPPILNSADAKILAALTEGMILITKMGRTDRQAFKDCLDELKMSSISLLGLVANGVSRRH